MFWSSGILGSWNFEASKFWNVETLGFRKLGIFWIILDTYISYPDNLEILWKFGVWNLKIKSKSIRTNVCTTLEPFPNPKSFKDSLITRSENITKYSIFATLLTPFRTPTTIINDAKTDQKTAPDAPLFYHFRTPLRTPTYRINDAKTDQKTAPDAPLFHHFCITFWTLPSSL